MKITWFLHTIGLLGLRSTKFLPSQVDIFVNNGSFDLKSPKTSKIWSTSCLFHTVLPKKWQNVTFMAGSRGWVQLPRNILEKSEFLLFHSPLKGSLLQMNETKTTNWLVTRLQEWIQNSERPVFSKILITHCKSPQPTILIGYVQVQLVSLLAVASFMLSQSAPSSRSSAGINRTRFDTWRFK